MLAVTLCFTSSCLFMSSHHQFWLSSTVIVSQFATIHFVHTLPKQVYCTLTVYGKYAFNSELQVITRYSKVCTTSNIFVGWHCKRISIAKCISIKRWSLTTTYQWVHFRNTMHSGSTTISNDVYYVTTQKAPEPGQCSSFPNTTV